MGMSDRERVKDARMDHNLVDVQRIPAPWDVNGSDPPPAAEQDQQNQ